MKLEDRIRLSLRRRAGHVVLRGDLAGFGSALQVSLALKALQRAGELVRLDAGVYAKASRDAGTGMVRPLADLQTLALEAAQKLKKVAEPNVVNIGSAAQASRDHGPCPMIPATGVAQYVHSLARKYEVSYKRTSMDEWAETVTRLAGDEVRSGSVQDLLVALKRAGKLSSDDMAALLVSYLRERKQVQQSPSVLHKYRQFGQHRGLRAPRP